MQGVLPTLVVALLLLAEAPAPPAAAVPTSGEVPKSAVAHATKVLFGFIHIPPALAARTNAPPTEPPAQEVPRTAPAPGQSVVTERPLGTFRVVRDILDVLWRILRSAGAGLVVLWHRLHGRDLLAHPMRRRILELAQEHPGTYLSALGKATGIHRKSIEYHVLRMAREGLLSVERDGATRRVYPLPRSADAERSTRARLLAMLEERERTRHELAVLLSVTPQTVSHHAARLEKEGLLTQAWRGGRRCYRRASAQP